MSLSAAVGCGGEGCDLEGDGGRALTSPRDGVISAAGALGGSMGKSVVVSGAAGSGMGGISNLAIFEGLPVRSAYTPIVGSLSQPHPASNL